MNTESFYHLFANGDEAKDLISSESDYLAAFNLIGVCAANSNARVVSFSIEESHPHILLFGEKRDCISFMRMYETSIIHHITSSRGSSDGVVLRCDLYPVTNEDYLRNVAVYTIIQPTKDGKDIMPYDYLWGSGSLYFRTPWIKSIWQIYSDSGPVPVGSISKRRLQKLLFSKRSVPDEWLICDGFLLPNNYVAVDLFENIFVTPNCYRVFLGNNSRKNDMVLAKMAKMHGVILEDFDARKLCEQVCMSLFGKKSARWLEPDQRLELAHNLKHSHNMTIKQIAAFCRIPKAELVKYLK